MTNADSIKRLASSPVTRVADAAVRIGQGKSHGFVVRVVEISRARRAS
jgi:hypothetical protein